MIKQFNVFPSLSTAKVLFIGVFALSACLLSACSSAPRSLTYYLLHTTGDTPYAAQETTSVVLDKITLPEYLKHRGLVYQTSDTNLHISTSHLWAETGRRRTNQSIDQCINFSKCVTSSPRSLR